MGPRPALITKSILEDLANFKRRHSTNAFALNQYKRKAEKLREVDLPDYYTVLGAIACLEKDIDRMHYCHLKAIELSGGGLQEFFNYATSLDVSCLWQDAYKVAKEVFSEDPNDLTRLQEMVDRSKSVFRFHEILSYLDVWHKLSPTEGYSGASAVASMVEFMDKKGYSDDDFCSYFDCVSQYLHSTDIIIKSTRTGLAKDKLFVTYRVTEGINTSKHNAALKEICKGMKAEEVLYVALCHADSDSDIEIRTWDDAINVVLDDFKDSVVVHLCVGIVQYINSFPVDKLRHITFGSLRQAVGTDSDESDLLKAIQYLCGDRVHLLDPRFEYIEGDDVYQLSASDVRYARANGRLVHPETGVELSDFENNVFMYFEPSPEAKNIVH